MTPAQEALAEAARTEAARVYGATCPERRDGPVDPPNVARARLNTLADICDDDAPALPRALTRRRPDPARVVQLRRDYYDRTGIEGVS